MSNMQSAPKSDQEKFIDSIEELILAISLQEWIKVSEIKKRMVDLLGE